MCDVSLDAVEMTGSAESRERVCPSSTLNRKQAVHAGSAIAYA